MSFTRCQSWQEPLDFTVAQIINKDGFNCLVAVGFTCPLMMWCPCDVFTSTGCQTGKTQTSRLWFPVMSSGAFCSCFSVRLTMAVRLVLVSMIYMFSLLFITKIIDGCPMD